MITTIKNIIIKHYIVTIVIALVAVSAGYKIFLSGGNSNQFVQVKKGEITQTVTVTGKVKPSSDVTLAFEKSGKVVESNIIVGSRVYAGQTLVKLDSSGAYADYLKAQANLSAENANLDELKKGTRPEELAVYQTQITNAENELRHVLSDAYTKSDDAIHNNVDQLFSNPKTSNPQINVPINDSQIKNDINQTRPAIETILNTWPVSVDTDAKTVDLVSSNLNSMKLFVDKISIGINALTPSSGISQTTVDSYKASISLARTNLQTAAQKIIDAQSALVLAQKNLTLKQVGSTPEAIRAEEAKVMQNQAQVQSAESELNKLVLRAPISGIITKQDAKLGEIVTTGSPIINLISDSTLEIEANVSEINIGKVHVGNQVNITMDAFPGKTFKGSVTYIEPAETIIDGVVNFKVTVVFSEKYPDIKTGLTSNLEITTESKNDVLYIPKYSITTRDGKQYVQKKVGEKTVETEVTSGISGNDGSMEILSGLSEGDSVSLSNIK